MRRFWNLGVLLGTLCVFGTQGGTAAAQPLPGTGEATTGEASTAPAPASPDAATPDPLSAGFTKPPEPDAPPPAPAPVTEPEADPKTTAPAPGRTAPAPKDRSGELALGVEGTLGFRQAPGQYPDSSGQVLRLPALSLIYPASPLFNFQLLVGATVAMGAGSPATLQLGLTLRGIYLGLILSDVLTLTVPFGLGYTMTSGPDFNGQTATAHFFHLETGIRPEWFVTEYISLHTQAGVVISLLTGGQGSFGPSYDPGVGISLFANTNLLAQAGFTVWFK